MKLAFAVQGGHEADASKEYVPTEHGVHAGDEAEENVPPGQFMHVLGDVAALYLPASQLAQVHPFAPEKPALHEQAMTSLLPTGELELALQVWHTSVVAPTVVEYWPDKQLLQATSPGAVLYCPAMHSLQVPPLGPVEPALQVQAVKTELPSRDFEFVGHPKHVETSVAPTAAEYVPISQPMQLAGPTSALYFPGTHSKHVPPSSPDEPALQVQAVETELPKRDVEFVGHAEHVETWFAPTDAEYVPITQSMHVSDPASVLYFPAMHSEHTPAGRTTRAEAVHTDPPPPQAQHAWPASTPLVSA